MLRIVITAGVEVKPNVVGVISMMEDNTDSQNVNSFTKKLHHNNGVEQFVCFLSLTDLLSMRHLLMYLNATYDIYIYNAGQTEHYMPNFCAYTADKQVRCQFPVRFNLSHLPETVCGLLLHGRLVVGSRHGPRFGRMASGCGGVQQSNAPHALWRKTSTECKHSDSVVNKGIFSHLHQS